MSNENEDNFRIIFRSQYTTTRNNNIFNTLLTTYILEYLLELNENINNDTDIDFMNMNINNSNINILNEYLLQTGMRESEETYRYLEKKDITLNIDNKKFKDFITECKECVICKDEFKSEDDVTKLNCTHIFHNNCIKEWGAYKPECPVCRAEIESKYSDKN